MENPYLASSSYSLVDLLWEIEMVANEFKNGGIIMIRTNDGWRAFLGSFDQEYLQNLEETLDKNVPRYDTDRKETLVKEAQRLITAFMDIFPDYIPMKYVDKYRVS